MRNKLLAVFLVAITLPPAAAEERHGEAADVELSPAAIQNYGVKTMPAAAGMELPMGAVIQSRDGFFAYIKSGGDFREVELEDGKTLDGVSLGIDDEIVVEGAKYLRIIFLNNKNPSSGHSH
ncbi:MAG: hypothetical protein LBT45_02655 [Rickettsiales bacterium]|jgi:hypothetical protein|nr:hypothetical protein [Rickettsiales bacterium]